MVADASYPQNHWTLSARHYDFSSRFLDQAEITFLALDQDCRIRYINDFGCRLLGYERNELLHQDWIEICVPPRHRDKFLNAVVAIIEGRSQSSQCQTPIVTKDGHERIISWRNTAHELREQQGPSNAPVFRSSSGVALTGIDTTQQLADAEKARQRDGAALGTHAQLDSFSQLNILSEMTRGVMHQVSQPLTAASNYAQAGLRFANAATIDAAQIVRIFQRIDESVAKVRDSLLQMQYLAQREHANPKPCDINRIIRDTIENLFSEPGSHDVNIRLNLEQNCAPVLADPRQIQQILTNLLSNAVDATAEPRRMRIDINCERVDGEWIKTSIRDYGPGVGSEDAERIFKPFFTTKANGLGLGLSICQTLINDCGGRIGFSRELDSGAEFYFMLPALLETQEAAHE